MIEILIALLIVGIITVTLMSFINDYTERYRITVAQTDLNRIAQAIQLSERSFEERVRTISEPGGSISTQLAAFLVEVPTEDPWGHRFKKDGLEILVVDRGDPEGQAYVVDEGVGRIMCAGPDAKFSTRLGQDPPDLNRDLIVNYRLQPWIAYSSQNDLWIQSADGASRKQITTGTFENIAISPDGAHFTGIGPGTDNEMWVGTIDEENQSLKRVIPRPGFPFPPNASFFPQWYPKGASLFFVAGSDIYRYDYGLDGVFPITTGGALTGGDTAGQQHFIYNNGNVCSYIYTVNGGGLHAIAIAEDGRLAYNRRNAGAASGIHVVSASGRDDKLIKREDPSGTAWLPVAWLGTGVLIYMTDPPTVSQHTFYRINQDGGQDISLHENPMATSPPQFPTLSPDGTYLAFMISDTSGGVLKTDGSGFIKEVSGELLPWSISSGKINQNVPPLWQKDSSRFYIAIKDDPLGEIKQVTIDNNQASSPQVLEWDSGTSTYVLVTHGGFYGVSPESMALTSDETLMATISSNPKGIFIIPLLGPAGARTRADIAGIGVGEIPDSRWLGQ